MDTTLGRLRSLLNEPEPGLRTWHLALLDAMHEFGYVPEPALQKAQAQRDELLAVCEDAIQFVTAWTNNHPCTDGSPSRIGNRVIAKMRAAIAKAKGQ